VARPPERSKTPAGAEGAVFGAEPGDECGGFLGLAEAAHGDLGKHIVDVRLGDLFEDVGDDDRGGDAVHEDIARGEFLAERFGQGDNAALEAL